MPWIPAMDGLAFSQELLGQRNPLGTQSFSEFAFDVDSDQRNLSARPQTGHSGAE